MFMALLPLILQLATWLFGYLLQRKAVNDESKKIFLEITESLRKLQAINVKNRFEAEKQLDSNEQAWQDREKKPQ